MVASLTRNWSNQPRLWQVLWLQELTPSIETVRFRRNSHHTMRFVQIRWVSYWKKLWRFFRKLEQRWFKNDFHETRMFSSFWILRRFWFFSEFNGRSFEVWKSRQKWFWILNSWFFQFLSFRAVFFNSYLGFGRENANTFFFTITNKLALLTM